VNDFAAHAPLCSSSHGAFARRPSRTACGALVLRRALQEPEVTRKRRPVSVPARRDRTRVPRPIADRVPETGLVRALPGAQSIQPRATLGVDQAVEVAPALGMQLDFSREQALLKTGT